MRFVSSAITIGVLVVLLPAAGCASSARKDKQAPLAVSTPLPLDPTDSYQIAEWWTNGTQLLQLSESGVYRLYGGINRYHTPVERGQWTRRNYAAIWIEPYAQLPREPARVAIRRVGDELQLDVRDLQPMTAIDAPPDVIEDHLVGGWTGDPGTLVLTDNLRYSFARSDPRSSGPAKLATEEGGWHVQDDFLLLQPDSRGMPATVVRVHVAADGMFLEAKDGHLVPTPLPFEGS